MADRAGCIMHSTRAPNKVLRDPEAVHNDVHMMAIMRSSRAGACEGCKAVSAAACMGAPTPDLPCTCYVPCPAAPGQLHHIRVNSAHARGGSSGEASLTACRV